MNSRIMMNSKTAMNTNMQNSKQADKLFLSIVIANYNYGSMIGAAIESVLSQDCQDFEIIVVDGGSTDNSVNVIKSYEKRIAWWVSEPDKGQSDAFNKGFSHASGEYLTWLNADDILLPGTISAVKEALTQHPEVVYATGNFVRFLSSTKEIIEAKWGPSYLPGWMQGKGRFNPIYGPTTFWRKSVYDKIGPIDESLHYTMDVDYWARLTMAGFKQVRVNHYCWGFRMHNKSKTAEFGGHERERKVRGIMNEELQYIKDKTGYNPTKFWIWTGYIMRLLDGSAFRMLYNSKFVKGRNIVEHFKIDYKL